MFQFLKTAALSALIGFGALAAMPEAAQAQSGGVYLGFGNQGPSVGFHFNDRGRHDYRGRHYRERDRHQRPGREYRGACSPREAAYKASRMGLRDARVVSVNHRTIRVEGYRYGPRIHGMSFANARGCPVLR